MFHLLFILAVITIVMGAILGTHFLFVCAMFLVNKYLNKDEIKFIEYIKYW